MIAGPCPLETIRDDILPLDLYGAAILDLRAGAPRLRQVAFGVTMEGKRIELRYYTQPVTGYLRARLAVRPQWRSCPRPIDGADQRAGLEVLNVLAADAFRRGNYRGDFPGWLDRLSGATRARRS